MAYRDNVTALAKKLGISNDPGLREEDIKVARLIFCYAGSPTTTSIAATGMNRGGRLFIQDLATTDGGAKMDELLCNTGLRRAARTYFAELWESAPIPGRRPLIDAIRGAQSVEIVWK